MSSSLIVARGESAAEALPVSHAVAAALALAGLDTAAVDFARVRRLTGYLVAAPPKLSIPRPGAR